MNGPPGRTPVADAGSVTADEVELELPRLVRPNPHVRELAEPRRHAVDRGAAGPGEGQDAA